MKITVNQNEMALLFKHGVYKRLLTPGKHTVRRFFGEDFVCLNTEDDIVFPNMNLAALRKDKAFAEASAVVEVPDGHLAAHFVNGRIVNMLRPGEYAFWNIWKKHTFELIDMTVPDSACKLPAPYMPDVPPGLLVKAEVAEGETGLLFYDGVFQRTLAPGRYFFWNYSARVTTQNVDTRLQQLEVAGQEILTADKVSIRVNFVCSCTVTDPVSAAVKLKDFKAQLHVLVQLVLREFTGKYRFDELLRQKDSIGGYVLERLQEREDEFFVCFSDAGVKDIILPGEIRDIMNTVLVAEKSAQASVITRREETAATKSLLETAKLMDENATLYRLKELEYLERICDKVGNISLGAGDGILNSLRELIAGKGRA
jgi:regulator of protease activity HflC (stomatin/prohibitin superfamily)